MPSKDTTSPALADLRVGQKLTIISISSAMGHTIKREALVKTVLPEPTPRLHYSNGPLDGYRYGTYTVRGKRKEFYLDVDLDALVFEGWDIPIVIDSEIPGYSGFHGNACFNIALRSPVLGGPTQLREYIELNNFNPAFTDRDKAKIIIPGASVHDDGTLLYPELDVSHAVIDRMKDKLAANIAA